MADSKIGDLPQAPSVNDNSLLAVEQGGSAMHMTGAQFKQFARDSVKQYVASAEDAATAAQQAADRSEAARDSIVVDEQKLAQAVTDAQNSADLAAQSEQASQDSATLSESWAVGGTGTRTGEDANNSKYWAGVAQAEADRATVPVIAGVYNVILTDRVTGERYALLVESGRLTLLGVSDTLDATDLTLIDNTTGISYAVVVDSGRLAIEEV